MALMVEPFLSRSAATASFTISMFTDFLAPPAAAFLMVFVFLALGAIFLVFLGFCQKSTEYVFAPGRLDK